MKMQSLLIDGQWVPTPTSFEVTDPWSGAVVGAAAQASAADVRHAIAAAVAAGRQPYPAHERARILYQAATLVRERAEEFAHTIRLEAGKPITAARGEVTRAVDTLQLSAEAAKNLAGVTVPMDAVTAGVGLIGFEVPQPRGVVAAITPFNFPLNLVAHKVGPAIAAGCTVVLKPSEKTPLTAGLFAQAFIDAGLPGGRLNLVTGAPGLVVGEMVGDDDVAVLTFTGSAEVGWKLKADSPRKFHILELGSNTAMVVAADADLDKAAAAAIASSFTFAGQTCISLQRIYVHDSVAHEFLQRLTKAASDLPTGNPDDPSTVVGPLITHQARDRVASWIRDALSEGAILHCGADIVDGVLRPTVLSDVPATATIIREEAFGPVVSVNRFDRIDDAISAANQSRYGLNTAIYTSDIASAMAYAHRAEAGTVLINTPPAFRADHMPYGGVKDSGQGREGVPYAVRELTDPKLIIIPA